MKIKNQPFTPFTNSDGQEIKFYYNIRIKGHYEEWGSDHNGIYDYGQIRTQSNSEYTVISYNSQRGKSYSFDLTPVSRTLEVSPNGEVDFQVKALIGYRYEAVTGPGFHGWFFEGKESGWSTAQTITIPPLGSSSSSSSSSPIFPSDKTIEPAPKETQQTLQFEVTMELSPTAPVVAAAIAAVAVGATLMVYFKKRRGGQPA